MQIRGKSLSVLSACTGVFPQFTPSSSESSVLLVTHQPPTKDPTMESVKEILISFVASRHRALSYSSALWHFFRMRARFAPPPLLRRP